MIQEVIKPFKTALEAIPYLTKVGGVVTTISKKIKEDIKRFPVYINGDINTCDPDDYISFVPDSSEVGAIYFEDLGTTAQDKDRRKVMMRSRVRMVGFFNLKKMAQTDTIIIVANMLDAMPRLPVNSDNVKNIRYSFAGEQPKSDAIFNRYTYNETEKQYLIYPFGYFALDFDIDWDLRFGCIDLLTMPDPPVLC